MVRDAAGSRTISLGGRATGPACMVEASKLRMIRWDRWLDIDLASGDVTESRFESPAIEGRKVKPVSLLRLPDGKLLALWRPLARSPLYHNIQPFKDENFHKIAVWDGQFGPLIDLRNRLVAFGENGIDEIELPENVDEQAFQGVVQTYVDSRGLSWVIVHTEKGASICWRLVDGELETFRQSEDGSDSAFFRACEAMAALGYQEGDHVGSAAFGKDRQIAFLGGGGKVVDYFDGSKWHSPVSDDFAERVFGLRFNGNTLIAEARCGLFRIATDALPARKESGSSAGVWELQEKKPEEKISQAALLKAKAEEREAAWAAMPLATTRWKKEQGKIRAAANDSQLAIQVNGYWLTIPLKNSPLHFARVCDSVIRVDSQGRIVFETGLRSMYRVDIYRVDQYPWSPWKADDKLEIVPGTVVPPGEHRLEVRFRTDLSPFGNQSVTFTFSVDYDRRSEITGLVDQLGSDFFETREEAFAALREMGPYVGHFLNELLADQKDPEVRRRLAELTESIDEPLKLP